MRHLLLQVSELFKKLYRAVWAFHQKCLAILCGNDSGMLCGIA